MKLLKPVLYCGIFLFLFITVQALVGCGAKQIETGKDHTQKRLEEVSALNWYNVESDSVKYVELSRSMDNISGLCFTADNRLFCDLDDTSGVSEIDPLTGKVTKTFYVGDGKKKNSDRIKSNYEDLAIVGSKFYILNSHGRILETTEGKEGEFVVFNTYKLALTKDNNIEGMCYDPETNSLLLACKDYPGENYDKKKTVYSFSLSTMSMSDTPRFALPEGKLKRNTEDGEFRPSGIARVNLTGTFFIISYHGHSIIEVSRAGDIINQRDLPESIHPQPEGIAFDKDNTMFISDEGKDFPPRITAYKLQKR